MEFKYVVSNIGRCQFTPAKNGGVKDGKAGNTHPLNKECINPSNQKDIFRHIRLEIFEENPSILL